MTNYIWITAQREMIHKYPMAPDEVSFLRNEHRHIFHFKVYIQVNHDDRDVEFIIFKRFIQDVLSDMNKNLDIKSCEMISDYIHKSITKKYPGRHIKIEVSEDGENGSLYEYPVNQ